MAHKFDNLVFFAFLYVSSVIVEKNHDPHCRLCILSVLKFYWTIWSSIKRRGRLTNHLSIHSSQPIWGNAIWSQCFIFLHPRSNLDFYSRYFVDHLFINSIPYLHLLRHYNLKYLPYLWPLLLPRPSLCTLFNWGTGFPYPILASL